ncbi:MAG: IMP dehydrogenase [archaeon]
MERRALTFDDILLVPQSSGVLPSEVSLTTRLTKNISLNIPLVSAAMDTVTESATAIAMARQGGIGVIHKNLSIEEQVSEVRKVKERAYSVVLHPRTVSPTDTLEKIFEMKHSIGISSFPVVEGTKLVGIVTARDLLFEHDHTKKVSEVMTKKVVSVVGMVSTEEAKRVLHENRIEKLPIVDDKGNLKGLLTITDVLSKEKHPSSLRDAEGRFVVGAAIGPKDFERLEALIKAETDVIFLDTSHGHSKVVVDAVRKIKSEYAVELVAGNIATKEAAEDLISAGADAVKVGIGPGAICTTRVIAGVGMPQFSAIIDTCLAATKSGIPVIADGGVKYSGDITKALAAGASSVMLGSLFAGCEESPGKVIFLHNRKFKQYRGMGSLGAMKKGSSERYFQNKDAKLVPEGVEGVVPYKGTIYEVIYQMLGGLRSGMGLVGAKDIETLRTKSKWVEVTAAGTKESHPHDIIITEEAPNYAGSSGNGV